MKYDVWWVDVQADRINAVFAIEAEWLTVKKAAPMARWCIGRPLPQVLGFWNKLGAKIERIEP